MYKQNGRLMCVLLLSLPLGACATLGAGIQSDPESQRTALAKAEALYQAGQYEEARLHFEKIAAQGKGNAEAEFRLGNIAMRSENLDDAVKHYTKTLTLKPESSKAHYNLATAYLAQAEQHFHYFTATSSEKSQPLKLFELLGALELFSSEGAPVSPASTSPLDGLAEALSQQRDPL